MLLFHVSCGIEPSFQHLFRILWISGSSKSLPQLMNSEGIASNPRDLRFESLSMAGMSSSVEGAASRSSITGRVY